MTGIPVINVNNNCSTALFLARQAGSIAPAWPFDAFTRPRAETLLVTSFVGDFAKFGPFQQSSTS